ncbi:hypothetical protein BBJ28_00015333 [Nothophytophthora sp. Chile5]|nr:hypothetical protein BBJ28_00015333 [Nothophytophthora sp. Chile5]
MQADATLALLRACVDCQTSPPQFNDLGTFKSAARAVRPFARPPHTLKPQFAGKDAPRSTMPKSTHSAEEAAGALVEDHAAMKKQWQTNLEIDLLKSAWIRKDREQHGAHTSPPLSAAK